MLMEAPSAPGFPDCWVTVTPGAKPCNKLLAVATCLLTRSSFFKVTTEPVRFTFFWVPKPTTTTSFNSENLISKTTLMVLSDPTSIVLDSTPIPEKETLVPFFAWIENWPSTLVKVLFLESKEETVIPSRDLPVASLTCPL